jgi:two-component system, LytTR family, sensor kinase
VNKVKIKLKSFIQVLNENRKTIYKHLIIWVIYWATEYAFGYIVYKIKPNFFSFIENAIFLMIYFYFFVNFAYNNKKTHSYLYLFLSLSVFLILTSISKTLIDAYIIFNDGITLSKFGVEIWRLTTITFYATAYSVYLHSLDNEKKIRETEKKLLLTEISFLKAQINPHFLFNTLNFVYNDVCMVSPVAGDVILQLTDMMRYSVDSTKYDIVQLSRETEAIDNYITLQKTRFDNKVYINFTKKGKISANTIPPLILLSIVENAFKFGILNEIDKPVDIKLNVTAKELIFECINTVRSDFKDKETNSVGLSNIRRRLEIVYNDRFELSHNSANKKFIVLLKIFY